MMKVVKVLRRRPAMFFRLSGIRLADFDDLVAKLHPLWLCREEQRLSSKTRQRGIGGGRNYRLTFAEQLLLCLIYYRTYTSQVFVGLVFGVSSPTVCRRVQTLTLLMAGHFRIPQRRVKLSQAEQDELLYLMIDGTERPVERPQKRSQRKVKYSGKKKRHTVSHQIITDSNKRILAVGPARGGRKHDKRIYDESRVEKPPDMLVLGDLGYLGTSLEIPLKPSKNHSLSQEDKTYNNWHSKLRIGVEHGIGRMKKFRIFADIHRGNGHVNMIAQNVAALANLNLKTV
jgi:hypothetical protein